MAQAENLDSRLSAGDKIKAARSRVGAAGQSVGDAGNRVSAGDRMKAARDRVSAAGDRTTDAGDRTSSAGQMIKGNSTAAGWPGNVGNNIDNGLLNRNEEEGSAGKLRNDKRGAAANSGQANSGAEEQTLRQRVQAARQAMNLKEMAKEKLKEKALAPAKLGTSRLLELAWLNLIDSFGLTLIWINIHVLLKWVLGEKLFCKLGEEWLPKQVTQLGGDTAEPVGRGIGLIEVIVLLILDLIVLGIIFAALAQIILIAQIMQATWSEKAFAALKIFWGAGWDTLKLLYDLFANLK